MVAWCAFPAPAVGTAIRVGVTGALTCRLSTTPLRRGGRLEEPSSLENVAKKLKVTLLVPVPLRVVYPCNRLHNRCYRCCSWV